MTPALQSPERPNVLGKSSDPLEYLSASRLNCFQTCRLQYYFRYVAKLPSRSSPALLVGQVVHAVLQAWNLARWRGNDASVEAMEEAFAALWESKCEEQKMCWKSTDAEETEKAKAWRILDHYLCNSPIPLEEKPEAVEVVVEREFRSRGLPPLKGIIDLVRGGGRIVDFKTTARTPDPVQARHLNLVQLGCYALLYREATGTPETGFELHFLVKTKEPKLVVTTLAPMGQGSIDRLFRVMESYLAGVEAEDFVPSPGMQCGFCDYLNECRAWRKGG